MTKKIFALTMAFLLSGCGMQSDTPAPVINAGAGAPYSSGIAVADDNTDTVSTLAKRYAAPSDQIAELNHVSANGRLKDGQRVLLPMPHQYTVKGNDTLFSVSRMFRVSMYEVVKENGLKKPFKLKYGQVLRIPNNEADASTTASRNDSINKNAAKQKEPPSILGAVMAAFRPKKSEDNAESKTKNESLRGDLLKSPFPDDNNISATNKRRFHDMLDELARMPDNEEVSDKKRKGKGGTTTFAAKSSGAKKLFSYVPVEQPALFNSLRPEPREFVGNSKRSDFMWPVAGSVVSGFGPKAGGLYNDGINISAPRGSSVAAAADGTVAYAGNKLEGYGNLVLIRHGRGLVTAYAHLSQISVHEGAHVRKGQKIGTVGSTGTVASSQLHFEVRQNGDSRDPRKFLG